MYKLMVVDDEPIAVESVVVMVKRNFPGVFAIRSCRSGKMAIETAEEFHPDIMIMDIDMPGINGLEAIKKLKESQSDITFVILSAFDYFSYAQEALSLGVIEYLVKPVTETRLTEVLEHIVEEIKTSSHEKQKRLEQQERLLMSIPVLERTFCETLALREEEAVELKNTCALLGFHDVGGYVLLFSSRNSKEKMPDYYDFKQRLKHSCHFIMEQLRNKEIVLYVFCDSDGQTPKTEAEKLATKFIEYARQKGVELICGAGNWYNTVSKAGQSFDEAKKAIHILRDDLYAGMYGPVLDAVNANEIEPKTVDTYREYLQKYVLQHLDKEDPLIILREYEKMLAFEVEKKTPFHEMRNVIVELELEIGRSKNIPVDHSRSSINKILSTETADELIETMGMVIAQNADFLTKDHHKSLDNLTEKAKTYIIEHYAETITLEDVANNANLSQYYFSRLFKQETGTSFIDFLTKIRIEKSKKLLLMEGLSVKEIAYMVGFNDPNYFSKAFKKATGESPVEYRKR